MKRNFLFLCCTCSCFLLQAQITLLGELKELVSEEPIVGAVVEIPALDLKTVSDPYGNYALTIPEIEEDLEVEIIANALSFETREKRIQLKAETSQEIIYKHFFLKLDPHALREVVVTANKVEEEQMDVPISLTVLDRIDLRKRSVVQTQEAFQTIPNLLTDAFLPSQASFSLRGLASDFVNSVGTENSVGFYIDDVFYSRSFHFNQTLFDIERVEVLRGPQGTLFGKNTIGGVLHVVSETPKMDNYSALEMNVGNYGLLQTRAKTNVMLIPDTLAVRIAGTFLRRDGWLKDGNEAVANENQTLFYGGRASINYQPTERLNILFKGALSHDDKAEFTVDFKPRMDGLNILNLPVREFQPLDRQVFTSVDDAAFDRKNYSAQAKIVYEIDDIHTLTSISAMNGSNGYHIRDIDASSVDGVKGERSLNIDAMSQEIRISTPRTNRKLFYVGGFYFLKEKLENVNTLTYGTGYLPIWSDQHQNPDLTVQNYPDYAENVETFANINSKSIAGFGNATLEIAPKMRLNAGLRYTFERKILDYWQLTNPYFEQSFLALSLTDNGGPIQRIVEDKAISWNFGMDFKTVENALFFVNISRGFKGAGFNTLASTDWDLEKVGASFRPEFVNSYEIGYKMDFENRYRFTTAVFVTDFKDKQEVNVINNETFVANAESVQGMGVEAEFLGLWSKFFRTEFALGVIRMQYVDFPFWHPLTQEWTNLTGNRAYKSPDVTFKIAPELNLPLAENLKMLIRADYNFVGKAYNDILNVDELSREPAGILNGRLQLSNRDEKYVFGLWAKNLLNESYLQHGFWAAYGNQGSLNAPRTVGMEFRVNFY